jgi:hypothetical protein
MQARPITMPADPEVTHPLTLDLLRALMEANWRAVKIGVASAELRHEYAPDLIRVVMDPDDTTRLSAVFINCQQVPFRRAIEYAMAVR